MAVGGANNLQQASLASGTSSSAGALSPRNRLPTPTSSPLTPATASLQGRATDAAASLPDLSPFYSTTKQKIDRISLALPSGFITSDKYRELNEQLSHIDNPINLAIAQDSFKKQKDPEKFILSAHISAVQALLCLTDESTAMSVTNPPFVTALNLLKIAFEEIQKSSNPDSKKMLLLQEMVPLYRLLKDSPAYQNENQTRHFQEFCTVQIELILKLIQAKSWVLAQSHFGEIFNHKMFEAIALDQKISLLGLKAALATDKPRLEWGEPETELVSLTESSLAALKQESSLLFPEKSQAFSQALGLIIPQIDLSQTELRTSLIQVQSRYSPVGDIPKNNPPRRSSPNLLVIGIIALCALALIALIYRNWKRRG